MNYSEVQTHLDIVKWHESEDRGMDMCRHMPYCEYCRGEEEPRRRGISLCQSLRENGTGESGSGSKRSEEGEESRRSQSESRP